MSHVEMLLEGLNCQGCVSSVGKRLLAVPGVTAVSIDLVSGGTSAVTITTEADVPNAALEAAVLASGKRVAAVAVA